jgi:hypothetical protein
MLRAALTGLGLGAAWGVLARIWMRLVTDTPEFSWTGSMFIVGLSAWFGLFVGAAAAARRAGGGRWWLLLAVPGLLLFASQGAFFFPGSLVAAVALSRRSRPGLALAVAVVAVSVVPVLVWDAGRLNEDTMLPASTLAQVSTLVGMPLLGLWLGWHARDLFRRAPRPQAMGEAVIGAVDVRVAGPREVREARAASEATTRTQSASPDLALSSRRSDSSLEAPAGPA